MSQKSRDEDIEELLSSDPMTVFDRWLHEAFQDTSIKDPNAVTVATADKHGIPDARNVLLKEHTGDKFIFYSSYESKKGRDTEENPNVALVFLWASHARQVRVRGTVKKCSPEKSDKYFASRPRENQVGTWASKQSCTISGRNELDEKIEAMEQKFGNEDIPRPSFWGGYEVTAKEIEFWVGGASGRMNDRFLFEKSDNGEWTMSRLSP
eukprot:gb/GECG01003969.1/.p1 GENE.gb/GECG01003969.1/~~gb/GECG01003969.1/.p1  ORF type:complete len:209 (+),score=36.85 gb/GECG01003969.1/:1-627(+)